MTRRTLLAGVLAAVVLAAAGGEAADEPPLPAVQSSNALPACDIEDASSGPVPCRWDAGHEGNGLGESFTVSLNEDGTRVFTYDNGRTVTDR